MPDPVRRMRRMRTIQDVGVILRIVRILRYRRLAQSLSLRMANKPRINPPIATG